MGSETTRLSQLGISLLGGMMVSHASAAPSHAHGNSSPHSSAVHHPHKKPHAMVSHSAEHITVQFSRRSRNGGGGMIRQETAPHSVQTVTKEYIATRSPTSTPLDLVQMLPSMNVTPSDTSGMKGGAIAIRGLTDADMGLMLNGAPTTNVNYLNEETDPENIENVSVTPGSSALDIPTSSAAAGVMNVTQRDPSKKRGGMVDFSYGTNNLSREFIRFDSGEIGHSGIRTFASFSHAHARSWMGAGTSDRKHIDFGLRKDWNNGSTFSIHTSWNNEVMPIDNYPTEEQFKLNKHTGIGWNHSDRYTNLGGSNNYWRASTNSWNQLFVTAPLHAVITPKISFDLTPYLSFGQGWTANGPSSSLAGTGDQAVYYSNGTQVAEGQQLTSYFQQNQNRVAGAIAKFNVDWNRHNRFTAGYWYENNISEVGFPTSTTDSSGGAVSPNRGDNQTFVKQNGQLLRNTSTVDAGYEIHGLFVQNSSHYLHNRLTVITGLKFIMTNYWYNTTAPGTAHHLGKNDTSPMPQLSIGYKIDEHNQIYVNAEGDFRQPTPSDLVASGPQLPKNQYSIKEELGYRYNNRYFMIDASFFNYNITNRLVTTYLGGGVSNTINAGNQTSRGFDFLIAGKSYHHFSPYASVEYLHSTIDTNVAYQSAGYLPTKGKQAPLAPHVMANVGLTYDDSHFFGNFGLHYAGPQSVTLVGDQRMPGYITNNLSVGYHFPAFLFAKSPTFKLNFTNLTGAKVRSGANGIQLNRQAVALTNGHAGPAAGSGALFYAVPRFTVTGTVSTSF